MWSRALAGLVAGFFLAAAAVALLTWLSPGPWQATVVPGLVAFVPAWIGGAALAFAFRSGRRAWAWMGASALAAFGALWALRSAGWVA